MAPGASLINLRVLDANGESSDSTVISAIQTAIQLKSKYNIRVINLSLGRPPFESYTLDPLCQAVEAAWKAGIVVVVAAGNDGRVNTANNMGYGTINSPANDPYALTVGAMKTLATYSRTDDLMASYSSKGPSLIDNTAKPDIVAPGNLVVSALSSATATLAATSSELYPGGLLQLLGQCYNAIWLLLFTQRHEHGRSRHERRRGRPAAGTTESDPGPSEGSAYADLVQDLPVIKHSH
jgi:subtilisin family serine protease